MKTQISDLKNGSIHKNGGTSTERRMVIASKVISENPECMNILIKGVKLTLCPEFSVNNNLTGYCCDISLDQFKTIESIDYNPFVFESSFSFEIGADMKARISKCTRKSDNHQWQYRGWDNIDESLIEIL